MFTLFILLYYNFEYLSLIFHVKLYASRVFMSF
uniref:Uncharacterized protein n=1 Tax=Rhizophora mucronata TaxID=61149 RepID=A0A2P2QHE6_RHIMU